MFKFGIILLGLLVIGCSDSENNSINDINTIEPQLVVDNSNVTGKIKSSAPNITGKWEIVKMYNPFEFSKSVLTENIVWEFDSLKNLIIKKNDSVINNVNCSYDYVLSGFSIDSVWVLKGEFDDLKIQSQLEIWLNGDSLKLIDQCDDCYSFDFVKIE